MEFSGVLEKLREQEWYQQIQGAYQQLPVEQQNYVKWGSLGAGLLLLMILIFSMARSAGSLRREYHEKQELVRLVTDASEELRRLRGQSSSMSSPGGEQNWKSILGSLVSDQGIPIESLEILQESPGATENVIQETLLEFRIKSIPIRPLVQILSQIHQGAPPMKLKGLLIESDVATGQLNAKLNVSGYLAKGEKSK
jgi:hypothetical protein